MINQDRMIFGDFSCNFELFPFEILQKPFLNKMNPPANRMYLLLPSN